MSIRADIMDGLLAQLQTIVLGDTCASRSGETYQYQTNLGASAYLFRRAPLAADEPEMLNIIDPTLERTPQALDTVENSLPVAVIYWLKGDSAEARAATLLAEEDLIKCLDAWESTLHAADCIFSVDKSELLLQQNEMGFAALKISLTVEYTTTVGSC